MTPFQEALLAIEIAVDALNAAGTDQAHDALDQIKQLGFDTRSQEERNRKAAKPWTARRAVQQKLFSV